MKKIVLVYGGIAGAIMSLMLIITFGLLYNYAKEAHFEGGEIIGYSSMVLAMSMIFIGVGIYRARYLSTNRSVLRVFFKTLGAGLLIALIASAFYVITWVIMYKGFMPDFLDNYSAQMIKKAQEAGKSAADIAKMEKDMAWAKELYSTWPGLIGITFMEIFPVGFIMSLLASIIYTIINYVKSKPSNNSATA